MAKIKVTDLPRDAKISAEEMKKVFGGASISIRKPVFPAVSPILDASIVPQVADLNLYDKFDPNHAAGECCHCVRG